MGAFRHGHVRMLIRNRVSNGRGIPVFWGNSVRIPVSTPQNRVLEDLRFNLDLLWSKDTSKYCWWKKSAVHPSIYRVLVHPRWCFHQHHHQVKHHHHLMSLKKLFWRDPWGIPAPGSPVLGVLRGGKWEGVNSKDVSWDENHQQQLMVCWVEVLEEFVEKNEVVWGLEFPIKKIRANTQLLWE